MKAGNKAYRYLKQRTHEECMRSLELLIKRVELRKARKKISKS